MGSIVGRSGQVIKDGELDYEATMLLNGKPRPMFKLESPGDFQKFQRAMRRVLGPIPPLPEEETVAPKYISRVIVYEEPCPECGVTLELEENVGAECPGCGTTVVLVNKEGR